MTAAGEPPSDHHHPLIGRIAHGAVVLGVIGGPAWLSWERADAGITGIALGALVAILLTVIWFGTYTPGDPDLLIRGFVPVPGRIRLLIELILLIGAGAAIWLAWNRAAGETFLTLATIVYAVNYPRLAALYRNHSSAD